MFKRFRFQNIEYIKEFLYYSRNVSPILCDKYCFHVGSLDSIAIVEFECRIGKRAYIVDMNYHLNFKI